MLSSLQNEAETEIKVQPIIPHYYDCFTTSNATARLNHRKLSMPTYSSMCLHQCSENISALTTPIALPDYHLHRDYAAGIHCSKALQNRSQLELLERYTLHNSNTGDILESLDIVLGGGVIEPNGQIRLPNNTVLQIQHFPFVEDVVLHLKNCIF